MQTKDKVLQALLAAEGRYLSGAALARELGCSRTAVWKAIEQLKAEGCEIGAVTNRGYSLKNAGELFLPAELAKRLSGARTSYQFHHFPELDSTNNRLKELAAAGAPAGTVVIADRQTAGKGRLGKSFHSPAGGMYLSVLLRPDLPLTDMMAVTACTASAVHLALADLGITAQIKWVNDLFLNGKKICGILSEGAFNAELLKMDYLIIGIGINLMSDPALPEELRPIVTDIYSETGLRLQRADLIAAILTHLEQLIDELPSRTYLPIYKKHSCTLGHHVQFLSNGFPKTALAVDFADDAGLIVINEDGTPETIRTGTATPID